MGFDVLLKMKPSFLCGLLLGAGCAHDLSGALHLRHTQNVQAKVRVVPVDSKLKVMLNNGAVLEGLYRGQPVPGTLVLIHPRSGAHQAVAVGAVTRMLAHTPRSLLADSASGALGGGGLGAVLGLGVCFMNNCSTWEPFLHLMGGLMGGTLLGAFGYPWMAGGYARGVDTRIGPEHWRIENAAAPQP